MQFGRERLGVADHIGGNVVDRRIGECLFVERQEMGIVVDFDGDAVLGPVICRQTMLLTHMAPPSPTARLSLEKSWSIFCRLLPAETPIRQAFGQQLVK